MESLDGADEILGMAISVAMDEAMSDNERTKWLETISLEQTKLEAFHT